MRIHKEGFKSIVIAGLVFLVINLVSFYLISFNYPVLSLIIFITTFALFLFIVSFFRVPNRELMKGEKYIVAPADGKVVVIEDV